MSFELTHLIEPLDLETFVKEHLLGGRPHLSPPRLSNVEMLEKEIPEFNNLEALLATPVRVQLFGPGGLRGPVENSDALSRYERGSVLYMTNVHEGVPAARELIEGVCGPLGIHPSHVRLEAFAGKAGATSTMHYDPEFNFHVLLRGRKKWTVEKNRHIENPMAPHHQLNHPKEELLATKLPFPREFVEPEQFEMERGSTFFFPVGYWHEVETLADSFAINVVLDPPRLFDAFTRALANKLFARSEFRSSIFGMLGSSVEPVLAENAQRLAEELREAAVKSVLHVTAEDMAVASDETSYRWSRAAADRRLEHSDGLVLLVSPGVAEPLEIEDDFTQLMRKLIRVEGRFDLQQLCTLAPNVDGEEMLQWVLDMRRLGFLTT